MELFLLQHKRAQAIMKTWSHAKNSSLAGRAILSVGASDEHKRDELGQKQLPPILSLGTAMNNNPLTFQLNDRYIQYTES